MAEIEKPQEHVGLDAGQQPPAIEKCDPPVSEPCKAPTDDDIRLMAYWIWTEREAVGLHSDPNSDWFQAENFLWAEYDACQASKGNPNPPAPTPEPVVEP